MVDKKVSLRGLVEICLATLKNVYEIGTGASSKKAPRISDKEPDLGKDGKHVVRWRVESEDGNQTYFDTRTMAKDFYSHNVLSSAIVRVESTSEGFVIDERKIQ